MFLTRGILAVAAGKIVSQLCVSTELSERRWRGILTVVVGSSWPNTLRLRAASLTAAPIAGGETAFDEV
jgi:hypothetical protein